MRAEHASKDNLKMAVASMPATVTQVLTFDQLHRHHCPHLPIFGLVSIITNPILVFAATITMKRARARAGAKP